MNTVTVLTWYSCQEEYLVYRCERKWLRTQVSQLLCNRVWNVCVCVHVCITAAQIGTLWWHHSSNSDCKVGMPDPQIHKLADSIFGHGDGWCHAVNDAQIWRWLASCIWLTSYVLLRPNMQTPYLGVADLTLPGLQVILWMPWVCGTILSILYVQYYRAFTIIIGYTSRVTMGNKLHVTSVTPVRRCASYWRARSERCSLPICTPCEAWGIRTRRHSSLLSSFVGCEDIRQLLHKQHTEHTGTFGHAQIWVCRLPTSNQP